MPQRYGPKPLKVLVVDDDPAILGLACRILERTGYEVLSADGGRKAIEVFDETQPDIVLTDYMMPELDGVALTQLIRARTTGDPEQDGRYVPVMIFTAGQDPELLERSLGAGAIQFLTKPFSPGELRSRIRALDDLVRMHRDIMARKAVQEEEIALVKHLMELMVQDGLRELPAGFAMQTLQTRRINGDACSYQKGAEGRHYGCVVDAMGHGLVAAVSAMALLEVFLDQASADRSLPDLYDAMNRKHCLRFPRGRFSCGLLFCLDPRQGTLSVLNAGLPLVLLMPRDGPVAEVPSDSTPMGIVQGALGSLPRTLAVRPGDRFFACTDGLTDLIEQAEVEALLREPEPSEALLRRVRELIGGGEMHDDVSWILWTVPAAAAAEPAP